MSGYKDEKFFAGGGMNLDAELRLVPKEDWREAYNVQSGNSVNNKIGAIEGVLSNVNLTYVLPTGSNRVIGSIEDIYSNCCYAFLWNSEGTHQILKINNDDSTVGLVIEDDPLVAFLNFQNPYTNGNKYLITHSDISISPTQEILLYWVDNYNEPKELNVTFAIDNPAYVWTVTELNTVHVPPNNQITSAYGSDSTVPYNKVYGRLWQFAFRYWYRDGGRSRLSSVNQLILPVGQDLLSGPGMAYSPQQNNFIALQMVGSSSDLVDKVELCVRQGNDGVWYQIDVLPNDPVSITYNFYNDTNLIAVDPSVYAQRSDNVPLVAATQELLDNRRLAMGNVVEGYDNVGIDVEFTVVHTEIDLIADYTFLVVDPSSVASITDQYPYILNSVPPSPIFRAVLFPFTLDEMPRGTTFTISLGVSGAYWKYVITDADYEIGAYPTNIVTAYTNWLTARLITPTTTTYLDGNGDLRTAVETSLYPNNGNLSFPLQKFGGFKQGATHKFGLIYFDEAFRNGGAISNDSCLVYCPYITEWNPSSSNINQQTTIQWLINHDPPSWAKYYSWVYFKSDVPSFLQVIDKAYTAVAASNVATTNTMMKVNIDPLSVFQTDHQDSTVSYDIQAGQYVRWATNKNKEVLEQYIELQILKWDPATKEIYVPYFDPTIFDLESYGLLEIFTRRSIGENAIGWEFGPLYNIVDGEHDVTSGTFETGDIYQYRRQYVSTIVNANFPDKSWSDIVESMNYSDWYDSDSINIGWPTTIIPEMSQKRYEGLIRYSNQFLQGTLINGLCTFDANDFRTINNKYGPINALVNVGYTLKVFQTRKLNDIYIGRKQIYNADGSNQLILSDDILSNVVPKEEDWGCSNPESIVKNARDIYYFDKYTGKVYQDTPGGVFPISDRGMIQYWRDFANTSLSSSGSVTQYVTPAIFDRVNQKYIISPLCYTDILIEDVVYYENTLADSVEYHEPTKKWKSFTEYNRANIVDVDNSYIRAAEYWGITAQKLLSFIDGQVWLHTLNGATTSNDFYDTVRQKQIKIITSQDPNQIKVFDSLQVYATNNWYPDQEDDIISYDGGRQGKSRIASARMKKIEGVWISSFLKDESTPNMGSVELARINGYPLRGTHLAVNLRNSEENTELFSVIINSTQSKPSK